MPINIVSVADLENRAAKWIAAFLSWSDRFGVALGAPDMTRVRLQTIGTHVDCFVSEFTKIKNDADFGTIDVGIQTDVTSILAELTTTTAPTIAVAVDPDALWSALPADAKLKHVKDHDLKGSSGKSADDIWASLSPGHKGDLIQHAPIAKTHRDKLSASVTVKHVKPQKTGGGKSPV